MHSCSSIFGRCWIKQQSLASTAIRSNTNRRPVCFYTDHGADVNTAASSVLDSDSGRVCVVSGEVCACVTFVGEHVPGSWSQRRTCLYRKFAGDLRWWISGGRAVVQKMLWGWRSEEKNWESGEKLLLHRIVLGSLHLKTPCWGRVALAWRWFWHGVRGRGKETERLDVTRTKQRRAAGLLLSLCLWGF